jgi:hypothetical protein
MVEMAERIDDDPALPPLPSLSRPVGLDVAGHDLVVGRFGLRSTFANRQSHLGHWGSASEHPLWLSPGSVLRAVAQGDLGDQQPLSAVVAVPGWFGFADRRAVREAVVCEPHDVSAMVASSTAAATHWYVERSFQDARCVLAIDVRFGATLSVVTLSPDGVAERCVASVHPSVISSSTGGAEALDRVVDGVVEQMVAMSLTPFDELLLVGDSSTPDVESRTLGCLRRIGAAHWPPLEPTLLGSPGCVAEGAALLAAGRRLGSDLSAPEAPWTVTAAAPRGLGVLVERADRGTEVVAVLQPWTALPAVAGAVFADPRDEATRSAQDSAVVVAVQWFEIELDGGIAPTPVLVATLAAGAPSGGALIDAELTVSSDGQLVPRPATMWTPTSGPAEIAITERAPVPPAPAVSVACPWQPPEAVALLSASPTVEQPPLLFEPVDSLPPPSGEAVAEPLGRQAEQAGCSESPSPILVASLDSQAPPAEVSPEPEPDRLASPDPADRPMFEMPGLAPIDDGLLELLANAEVSPVALDEALLRCERVLSNEVDALVAVRSVYDLLDCDDDADPATLRAGARRLETVLEQRGLGDDLAAAVSAAVRAARRSFSDPLERRFLGGSRQRLEDELARVVEHLRLVVGDVSDVELRRMVADARRGGLGPNRIASVLTRLVGSEAADRVADLAVDGSQAVVIVDPEGGWCRLAHPDEAGVRIRVMVEQSAFALQ